MTQADGPALLRVVTVMDRLRSPGGCPWDAEQTHTSLARYLLEESYEVLEAIETADLSLLREELGDLLLQVLFHARLAEEAADGFSVEDVAADLEAKLVRRHPHVFADEQVTDAAEVNETWERRKAEEKGRRSAVDGVPVAQPALALADKLLSRAHRAGVAVATPDPSGIGGQLFDLVRQAQAVGVDPEGALRETNRAVRAAIQAAEVPSNSEADH